MADHSDRSAITSAIELQRALHRLQGRLLTLVGGDGQLRLLFGSRPALSDMRADLERLLRFVDWADRTIVPPMQQQQQERPQQQQEREREQQQQQQQQQQ